MLKILQSFFVKILDIIAPRRENSVLVDMVNKETVQKLEKAVPVESMPWIYPLFYYKDPKVKAIIWELKYRENTAPLGTLGEILYEEIMDLASNILIFNDDAQFLLIPIPISVSRRIERGFNQSEYIAKSILPYDNERLLVYAPQWLQKIKETEIQSRSATKEGRMKNLIGCFEANDQVSGKYVILIDDVVTTGSTLSEARTTLLSAGARDVFAFTLAH